MKNFTLIEKLKSTFGKEKLVRALIVSLVAPLLTVIIAPAQLAPTANAAAVLTSGPLSIESVSWNIVGLDSNNVNVGPNLFPFGAKVCNTSGSPVSNVSMSWTWGVGDATALNIRGSSNLPISDTGTATTLTLGVGANSCTYAFWSVEVTRASASYDKTRKYNISATDGTNTVNTDPDVAIKVEKLVSQARNDVQTLSISNGIPAVGDTATVTMTGATSTSYEQLTAWPVFDLSFAQIVSMNFTFTNDGTTRFNSPISQVYADACGWNQLTNACAGSGKAGGSVTVTMVIKRIAAGALNMNGVIYDFSGSSFHYNSDYGTDGLLDSTQIDSAVAANVANDDSFFTPLNTTLTSATVATNDSENVTPVTYTKLTNPTNGSISSFSTAGVFTYVPTTDFSGFDSFTYKLCKSDDNACDTATVNIVVGIQAVNDSVSVDYQGSLTSEPLNSNDYYNSYTLGTNIFYDTSTAVTSGAITSFNGSTGTFNYTAANGLSGPATFTYIICLTSCISPVETSTATVTINVGPRAVNESYSTTGTAPVTGNVSTNDIYPTSKTFRLNSTTNANGTVSLNTSTGAFTYTANGGFSGTATFTYDVCDSFGTCSTATVTITVAAPIVLITPDITWPTPAPIYYPTPLSSVQLNAVAKYNGLEVPGSYVYQYTSGTVLNPGSVALNVTFYPTDSGRYAQTTASVIQLVLTGISVLTWPTPTPKTGPYTLDPSVLNATCSVLGTFSYEPVLGTVLQPGTYTLKVTCTPTDPKIAPVSKTVTLVVNPTLTWVDPTEKTGPYTVDASILNAVCNTPGTLTYDPALGSVLQPGTYTLKVTCTPTDPTLKPLTTTVTLKVNQTLTWVDPSEKTGPYTLDASVLNAKCNTTSTLTYDPALGTVLQPGTYTLKVTCTPTDLTLKPITTTVTLKVNQTLTWVDPSEKTGPYTLDASVLNAKCNTTSTLTYDPALGAVRQPGTYTLKVTCTPTDPTLKPLTTTVALKVNPTLTWVDPTEKTGPYTLDASVLNAVCNTPGTLTYDPALGAVLQPGTYTLKVTCTPTDPTLKPLTTTVTLKVNPTLTWVDPTEKTGPYTVDASILNAVCNTPGTLTYDPALGAVLQPGTYTLKVTCTPTDPTLKPLTTTVTLKVNQTLTWVDPANKLGPYTLDASVLDAKCNTPGTLTYDPALGAVLQPGTYTLKVTCTPTDPTLKPITTTVPFKVVKPTVIDVQPLTIPGNLTTVVAVPIAIKALSPVVESVCAGLTGAVLASGQISYTPGAGFSGNTCVNVKVLIDGVLQNVRIPVVVSPVAPNAFKEPVTFYKGLITWSASPNATGYQVKIRGKLICTTIVAQLSCNAPQTVGPATPVLVTALGNDNTSTTVEAKYIPRRVLAFIVYFDIAKFALTKTAQSELTKVAKIMKEEGFVNLELAGHTDSSPFDNVTLAKNRSKSTYNFLKKRLPTLNPSINSYSDANPAAKNSSAANKAKNRRTEGYVY